MPTRQITVLIVDDHRVFRDAFEGLVTFTPGLTVWGSAESAEDALARLSSTTSADGGLPDVVVSDLSMPGKSGFELASALRLQWPDLPCVTVSAQRGEVSAAQARAAGAVGYVEKKDLEEILETIRRAGAARVPSL